MLYDNALLARAYLHGYQALGVERWREVAERTLDWALLEMRGPEGGFYSALDADSEGEEGRFYVWTPAEIRSVLEAAGLAELADEVIAYYGVTERGNFEGRNILNLIGRSTRRARSGSTRPEPRCMRRARSGCGRASTTSGWALERADDRRARGRRRGARARGLPRRRARYGEFVWTQMRNDDGRLLRTWKDGQARLNAYLEDHAFLRGAVDALRGDLRVVRWFELACSTADAMIDRFADPANGGFFTTSNDHEELVARRKDVDDHPIPSGNSAAAYGLLRLAALTGEHDYAAQAESVFRLFGHVAESHPHAVAHLLRAIDLYTSAVREVALVTPAEGEAGARGARGHRALAPAAAPGARGRRRGFRTPGAAARQDRRRRAGRGRNGVRGLRLPDPGHGAGGAGERARRAIRLDCSDGRGRGEDEVGAQEGREERFVREYFDGLAEQDRPRARSLEARLDRPHVRDGGPRRPGRNPEIAGSTTCSGPFRTGDSEVLELIASGEHAAARWRISATFAGPGRFQGIAPTGAKVELEGCDMFRVVDERIVENYAYTNGAYLAQQIGLLPPSGSAAERTMTGAFNAKTAATSAIRKLRER